MNSDELTRLLRNDVKKTINAAIRKELLAAKNPKSRRFIDPRKQVIARILAEHPGISAKEVCREMDKLQERNPSISAYHTLRTWPSRLLCEAYSLDRNRVKAFIGIIKSLLWRYSPEAA
jgi:hypothetical protein